MRISDWSSDVCSSDLEEIEKFGLRRYQPEGEIFLYRPCSSAIASTGYLGRPTIMEFLVMNDELRRAVMRHAGMGELEQIARQSGMRTLYEDGIVKALAGETDRTSVGEGMSLSVRVIPDGSRHIKKKKCEEYHSNT